MEELHRLIDDQVALKAWEDLKPIIYSKNGEPYGAIGIRNYRSGVLVLSFTKGNNPFLRDMIVFIRSIARICRVYILHDKSRKDISDNILRAFGKRFKAHQLVLKDMVITIGERRKYGSC